MQADVVARGDSDSDELDLGWMREHGLRNERLASVEKHLTALYCGGSSPERFGRAIDDAISFTPTATATPSSHPAATSVIQ